jgi:hypothetical protein
MRVPPPLERNTVITPWPLFQFHLPHSLPTVPTLSQPLDTITLSLLFLIVFNSTA